MNKYVKELHNTFDVLFFQKIANSVITEEWLSTPDFIALSKFTDNTVIDISKYKYFLKLKNKYPKLSNFIKFLKSSKGTWPVHVDNHRKCSINIPILNTSNTTTCFYSGGKKVNKITDKFGDKLGTWHSNKYITYVTGSKLEFEHTLLLPSIINVSVPHGLNNKDNNIRIICSLTYEKTYEEALKDFND